MISNASTSMASFRAPTVSSATIFRFELEVSDPGGLSDASTVNVTVSSASGGGSGGGTVGLWFLLSLLTLTRLSRKDAS